jgi:hypothetical protein
MSRDLRPQVAAFIFLLSTGAALFPDLVSAKPSVAGSSVRPRVNAALLYDRDHEPLRVERPIAIHSAKLSEYQLIVDRDNGQIADEGVILLIATQKTGLPRLSDALRTSKRLRRRSVSALIMHRVTDDANFVNKTKSLAARLADLRPQTSTETASVSDGAQFIETLIRASGRGPLTNVVVFGHAAPSALYMVEDRGFYAVVAEVAKTTPLAKGSDNAKAARLRAMGARDLGDLARLIEQGRIKFAANAVIVFAGCDLAGSDHIDRAGIAWRIADITGATVVASVGPTDQSMAGRRAISFNKEYSRGTWVRFTKGAIPRKLMSRWLDPLKELHLNDDRAAIVSHSGNAEAAGDISNVQPFRCASYYVSLVKADGLVACGIQAQHDVVMADRGMERTSIAFFDPGEEPVAHPPLVRVDDRICRRRT